MDKLEYLISRSGFNGNSNEMVQFLRNHGSLEPKNPIIKKDLRLIHDNRPLSKLD